MILLRIIHVVDTRLQREEITDSIGQQPDITLLATLRKNKNALKTIHALKPNIVLLDLGLATRPRVVFVKELLRGCPSAKVIVMDVIPIHYDILQYVEAGVAGFILKDALDGDILKTIRLVADEEFVLPPHLTGTLFSQIIERESNQSESFKLIHSVWMTEQEREIVVFLAEGMTNEAIAQKLHFSSYKVKSHIHSILEKMVLNTRIQLAIYAPLHEEKDTTPYQRASLDE